MRHRPDCCASNSLAAGTFFLFFRVLRTHFPGGGDVQQDLPVLPAHLARNADAIGCVFPEFFRLQQPRLLNPRKEATSIFGTLFSNNIVKEGGREPMDPDATSTAACRGALGAAIFRCRLSSIRRGMHKVGAAGRRSRRESAAARHGRNFPGTRRQERGQAIRPCRGLTPAVHFSHAAEPANALCVSQES